MNQPRKFFSGGSGESTGGHSRTSSGQLPEETKIIAVYDPASRLDKSLTMVAPDLSRLSNQAGLLVVVTHVTTTSDEFTSGAVKPSLRRRLKVMSRPNLAGKVLGFD